MARKEMDANTFERFMSTHQSEEDSPGVSETESHMLNTTATSDISQLLQTLNAAIQQNTQMMNLLQINQERQITRTPEMTSDVKKFHIMPDLSKSIGNFTGEGNPNLGKKWLDQLKNTAALHNWPEAFILQTAQNHLVGAAKHWWEGRNEELHDWSKFERGFQRTFIFEENKNDLWNRMQQRIQRPNETLGAYYQEKASMCKSLNLPFKETKEQIAIGLSCNNTADFVLSKLHLDEDDLFQDIINYERINQARRDTIRRKPYVTRTGPIGSSTRTANPTTKEQPRCYNCNNIGHIATNCPNPRRARGSCFECGATNHQVSACPTRRASRPRQTEMEQQGAMVITGSQPMMNVVFRSRKPLLHAACERGAWRCTQFLVTERSEEIHILKDEYYPIHYAVLYDSKFLELLINAGADTTVKTCTQQMTLLHVVFLVAHKSAEDTMATIRLLLDHGCKELINTPDTLGNTPLHALIFRYALEEARYGCDKWNMWDILHLVRYLIQSGAKKSINQVGNSALACVLRHVRDWEICYELLNMLLNEGGEPNMVGRDGSVPIMICLVPLINKDPLHHFTHSMKVCYLNCIRILLKKGANPNCSYKVNLTPLHVLVFTISENITLNCETQKRLNFEFIKTLLVLLLTHGLDPNVKVSIRTQHILQSCMDMIQNVRECKDIHYVHDLTLTLIQYGANPDLSLNMSEAIKNYSPHQLQSTWRTKNYILYYYVMLVSRKDHLILDPHMYFAKIIMLFYLVMQHKPLFECLKILYTQQLSLVPGKITEPLTYIIRDLYKRPRTLKQICRVKIHSCLHGKPGLHVNKLNLPIQMKDYLLNFEQ